VNALHDAMTVAEDWAATAGRTAGRYAPMGTRGRMTRMRGAGRLRPGGFWARLRRQGLVFAGLLFVGFWFGLTRTPRGLAAIVLSWVVLSWLGMHRADGWRQLARVTVEYVAVAALAFFLLTAAPATKIAVPEPQQTIQVDDTQTDQVEAFRQSVIRIFARGAGALNDGVDSPADARGHSPTGSESTPTTTRGGGR
jgi:hypothetical protein